MPLHSATTEEQRPRDFRARYSRSRQETLRHTLVRPVRRRRASVATVCLGIAIALPAVASPSQWDRFEIGNAQTREMELEPMPFEKPGSSFPGSAFYYLDLDSPEPALGEGIHSDAEIDNPVQRLDHGPAALSMRIDNSGVDRTRALQCLTAAVYYEAASEADSGQRAVAQVVLNRVAHPAYPSTVCGVVYQGSQRRTGCQFTFTCDGSLARRPSAFMWERAQSVARAALGGYVHAPVGLATHYHTTQIYPYWAPSLDYLGTIGAHRFYRFKGSAGTRGAFRFAYLGGEPAASALKRSNEALASSTALDPVALQRTFSADVPATTGPGTATVSTTNSPVPAPTYTQALKDRGGDALYRGDKLPDATGIRPEYRNSGRWIAKPGA